MKLNKILWPILFLFSLQVAVAGPGDGHGRDGGWPESIQLLRFAKKNLLELVEQSTDLDIQHAINKMHDRDEDIRPEDVNKEMLLRLINNLVDPDVLDIEKSNYKGVRLFYYDRSQAPLYKIYATKNFFNLEKYQVSISNMNIALIKEIQTLILHEVSHLWGFGEEAGDINYSRVFATRMVEILHGNLKGDFTIKEKFDLTRASFNAETFSLIPGNREVLLKNQTYQCHNISASEESRSELYIAQEELLWESEGHSLRSNKNALIRGVVDGYIMIKNAGVRIETSYSICHQDAAQLNNIVKRFMAPYYSRSNFVTDLDYASTSMFQVILAESIQKSIDGLRQNLAIQTDNQKQIIYNVEVKIKKGLKEQYEKLISRRSKYSKKKDSPTLKAINALINSDVTSAQPSYAKAKNENRRINTSIDIMKNYARRSVAREFMNNFFADFNKIVEMTQEHDREQRLSISKCGREKRIGKYYECSINESILEAQGNIQLYKRMNQSLNILLKNSVERVQTLN